MTTSSATLQLTITVTYDTNGVPVDQLKAMLEAIPSQVVGNGAFTQSTAAEVADWDFSVQQLKL